MSLKQKCPPNINVTKTEMSLKLFFLKKNQNFTRTKLSPQLKWDQILNVTKTLLQLKCHQKEIVTKSEISPKLKHHQN